MSDKKDPKPGTVNTWNPDIWGRNYRLTITPARGGESIVFDCGTKDKPKPPQQIVFNVTGAADAFRVADIAIYGVSRETREKIYKEYDLITLEAGYGDGMSQIFSGEINNYETGKDGASTYIKFYCFSQLSSIDSAFINKTWGENTPVADVVSDVAKTLSNHVELMGDFSGFTPLLLGKTMTENSIEAMNKLSLLYDFTWALEATKVRICRNNASSSARHEISVRTGMEGTPRVYEAGVEVDMRLNPALNAYDLIDVYATYEKYGFSEMYKYKSKQLSEQLKAQGVYKILSIAHKGDFYHDSWTTTISAYLFKEG